MTAMVRRVERELLDTMDPGDPRAVDSRADLRRLNVWMRSRAALTAALDRLIASAAPPVRLVELGAGDGALLLTLARRRASAWPRVHLELLDLHPVVERDTLDQYRALGWTAEVVRADVLEWLVHSADRGPRPLVVANLFVHHFEGARLQALLEGIAARARGFACHEPRRSSWALFASRLVGAIGCNAVTRHDAVVSVRAGFRGDELSSRWPGGNGWRLEEGAFGPFGHRFLALQAGAGETP